MSTSRRRIFGRQRNSQDRSRKGARKLLSRSLFAEQLESRTLMASDINPLAASANPMHNAAQPADVFGTGTVAPIDALAIINSLNAHGTQSVASMEASIQSAGATAAVAASLPMLDVNNDNYIDPADALSVIDELNNPAAGPFAMNINLTTTTLSGTPIANGATIPVGTQFLVTATVQDTRNTLSPPVTPTGVFAAYMGLNYTDASVDQLQNQVITINGNPLGGTFTLSFNGQTTAPITYNPSDSNNNGNVDPSPGQIQAALQGLSTIGPGNVQVTRVDPTTSTWTVKFGGKFANNENVQAITGDATGLTGGVGMSVDVAVNPNVRTDTPADTAADEYKNSVTFFSPYINGTSAIGTTPGIVGEVGSFAGTSQTNGGIKQLFTVEMTATAAGTLALTTTPATESPGHDVLFYGSETAVDTSTINYGSESLTVAQSVTAINQAETAQENSSNNVYNLLTGNQAFKGTLGLVSVGTPSHGTETTNIAAGTISYTPAANFIGTDSFTYTTGDGLGDTAVGTVTVTTSAVNQAPTITLGATIPTTTTENTPIVFSPANNNLPTFADVDGGLTNETVTISAANGTLTLGSTAGFVSATGNGTNTLVVTDPIATINSALAATTLTYQPNSGFSGADTITFNINDNSTLFGGAKQATKTLPITVNQQDQPPVITVPGAQSVNNTSILAFSAANSNAISVADADDIGLGSMVVTLSIPVGTLTVTNSPTVTGNGGTNLSISGSLATINSVLASLQYTPSSTDNGIETLTITANDHQSSIPGGPKSTTATVDITVVGVRPFASNETYTVNESSVAAGTPTTLNVLAQTFPSTGASSTLISFTQPATGGTVTLIPGPKGDHTDDQLSFVPTQYFSGQAVFTYTINDTSGTGLNSTGNVLVNVTPVNQPPIANPVSFAGTENQPLTISGATLIANANDLPGPVGSNEGSQTLTVTQVSTTSPGGAVVLNQNGTITYTPTANFFGTYTFTYTITDNGQSGSPLVADPKTATSTATINVAQVDVPPIAVADTLSTPESGVVSSSLTIPTSTLLSNDTPGSPAQAGQTLTITSVTAGSNGTVVLNGTNITFTPTTNYFGPASFTYTVSDNGIPTAAPPLGPQSSVGSVTVNVTPVNQPPVVVPESVSAIKNVATTYTSTTLLAGDTPGPANESGQTLTITGVNATSAQGGTVTFNAATGAVTYTPATDYTGTDSFTYTVTDNGTSGSPATADPQSTTATANVNVLNFVPSTISGFVYIDPTNSGVMSPGEPGLAGVTITLTGTDVQNLPVSITVQTGADGSYSFGNLSPGNYTVTATQPGNLNVGIATAGAGALAVAGTTNQVSIFIPAAGGVTSTDNNFSEGDVKPVFSSIVNPLLASANPTTSVNGLTNGLIFSFDNTPTSQLGWYMKLNGWDSFTPVSLVLSSGNNSAVLTVLNSSGQQVSATITAASGQLKFKADGAGHSIAEVIGASSAFNFAANSVVPSVMESSDAAEQATQIASAAVASSNNDRQYTQAADAVFAAMA